LANNVSVDEDKLWYEPNEALWCEDENEVVYHRYSDFVLGPGRVIKWIGNRPLVGTKYSIKYTAYFEWMVFQPPSERYDRDCKDIGPLVFLRRRHVAWINDSPYITPSDRIPIQKRIAC